MKQTVYQTRFLTSRMSWQCLTHLLHQLCSRQRVRHTCPPELGGQWRHGPVSYGSEALTSDEYFRKDYLGDAKMSPSPAAISSVHIVRDEREFPGKPREDVALGKALACLSCHLQLKERKASALDPQAILIPNNYQSLWTRGFSPSFTIHVNRFESSRMNQMGHVVGNAILKQICRTF